MAIKARATVTISRIVDILSVTRYYLLQSSTMTPPAKPTTNPPNSWETIEPTYTSGSTNTLYFVDCTVFTNDTFSYSEVSVSSSYEAAKEAYNKALSVEGRVDDCGNQIDQIRDSTHEEIASLQQNVDSIILSALKSYVKTGDFGSYKEEVSTSLSVLSNQLGIDITKVTEHIDNVNGDLQAKYESITKSFYFDPDLGLVIGETGNPIYLRLDNDVLQFVRNNTPELQITAEGVVANRAKISILIIGNVIHATDENGDEIVY